MASFQKTFRKSGSHNAESYCLQGVDVKIGEKFRPPKKVTLPVGWQQRDPSAVLSLTYDFSLEKEVIANVEALERKQREQDRTRTNESEVSGISVGSPPSQNAVFSNVGGEILQPVVARGTGHKKKDSFGGKGKGSFDLSDFEGDTSTPFELVELQTINDLDELKNVLQPDAPMGTSTKTPVNSINTSAISSNGSCTNFTSTAPQPQSRNSLVDVPLPSFVKPDSLPSVRPGSLFGDLTVQGMSSSVYTSSGGSYLVDVGDTRDTTQVSSPISSIGSSTTTDSFPSYRFSNSSNSKDNRPISRGGLLPPLGTCTPPVPPHPQTQQSYPSAALCGVGGDSYNRGIYTFPNSAKSTGKPLNSCVNDSQRAGFNIPYRQYDQTVSGNQLWTKSTSADTQSAVGRYPSPLPPIGLSSQESRQSPGSVHHTSSYCSTLPDPWPVLTEPEKSLVINIASMGFPTPRVSRGVQRIGLKEGEVIEFLVSVDELCEAGYEADSAEVALALSNSEKAKAITFLEHVKKFKEYGFKEENIQEALRAADSDGEKALEYLMTLSNS